MENRDNGRHCLSCCKTVVDFTGWDAMAIANYLRDNSQNKVCGRVSQDQMAAKSILIQLHCCIRLFIQISMAGKKIAAIVIIIFRFAGHVL